MGWGECLANLPIQASLFPGLLGCARWAQAPSDTVLTLLVPLDECPPLGTHIWLHLRQSIG